MKKIQVPVAGIPTLKPFFSSHWDVAVSIPDSIMVYYLAGLQEIQVCRICVVNLCDGVFFLTIFLVEILET